MKAYSKDLRIRVLEALAAATWAGLDAITPTDARGRARHAGYRRKRQHLS